MGLQKISSKMKQYALRNTKSYSGGCLDFANSQCLSYSKIEALFKVVDQDI